MTEQPKNQEYYAIWGPDDFGRYSAEVFDGAGNDVDQSPDFARYAEAENWVVENHPFAFEAP